MANFMNGMFGKIAPGMCRLSMSGGIAVKTSSGDYKSYNIKTGRLTNCSNFVFDIGQDFFFLIPTNKVEPGDIILVGGKPRCVVSATKNEISVINYDDSTKETIIPERHVFMGNTYFYGKIVSMFGSNMGDGKNFNKKIMKFMMMSEMMKGSNTGSGNNMFGNMLPMMMFMGGGSGSGFGFDNFFSDILGDDDEEGFEMPFPVTDETKEDATEE